MFLLVTLIGPLVLLVLCGDDDVGPFMGVSVGACCSTTDSTAAKLRPSLLLLLLLLLVALLTLVLGGGALAAGRGTLCALPGADDPAER